MFASSVFAVALGFGSIQNPPLRTPGQTANPTAKIPFSFVYGGKKSADLLPQWPMEKVVRKLDDDRVQFTVSWVDPATHLQARLVAIQYTNFPVIEMTAYLKNTGKQDTPIVDHLLALDGTFSWPGNHDVVLHHSVGSPGNGTDYAPLETPLPPGTSKRISAAGGRPTNTDLSYFNIASGNQGNIIVVGWPGQWAADFVRKADGGLLIQAGQELTHFRLHPGEEVRTPLIVDLEYKGDWIDAQNMWRRWMMAYGMPKPGGKLPSPMFLASSGRAYGEMIGANEANQIMHIDRYLEEGLKLDYWWMDAGWYVQDQGWPQVGTWEVDRKRFPNGFKPISDHAHAKGVKTLVWFEPERVAPHTWLADHHPEWLLNTLNGLVKRRSSQLGTGEPCIVFNSTDHELAWSGIRWAPHGLSFHPGAKGEYSVVRYTAPVAGPFKVSSKFSGIDEQTTTDVHVLHQGHSIFDSFVRLNGHDRSASFDQTVPLAKGDTIDFVVGYGNGVYSYDSTGLDAVITGPDGKPHNAAKEYGTWTYGYLSPGATPDATTFRSYDINEPAGGNGNQLLNLGNPVARKWLVEHVDKLIVDNGIDLYRQDFNFDPLSYWQGNDAPDRQGITENKHVVGYLAYWDELRRRHPNMLIDSCASGGRRNDLETMRRSVPLWRSDYAYEPIGHQCMTYGISMWIPFHGTATVAEETAPYYGGGTTPVHPYAFWSNTAPSLGSGIDIRDKAIDYAALRHLFGAWRELWPYYYADFYPVTPFTHQDDTWIGWQFNRPEKGDGVIQVFRRPKAASETETLKLRGLDRTARYRVTVIDGTEIDSKPRTGQELMDTGIAVTLKEHPAAAVLKYVRL